MAEKVRVAIVGVGNCASALVQGVSYYQQNRPGLLHWEIGPYLPSAIEFSAAFDVDRAKVGQPLHRAIFSGENNTALVAEVSPIDVRVQPAPVLDGLGEKYREKVTSIAPESGPDIVRTLRDTRTDVIVNYLPVGSTEATRWWAATALKVPCAFVNCIPEPIASQPAWQKRFRAAGVPLLGDDVKSQLGATMVHRALAHLFTARGVSLDRTYQLNFGGNMDFFNMLESTRLQSKRLSKRGAVEAEIPGGIAPANIHIGPSDYVPWLQDRKWCYIRMEGTAFAGVPLNVELKLEVWDSPNSAGVVLDLVRCAKLALDRGLAGPLLPVCAAYMKSPPRQVNDEKARFLFARWLRTAAVTT